MTVAARPQRPIPTVQASPELLHEGDMIYPDVQEPSPEPFRVATRPQRLASGWRIELDRECVLLVAKGHKVRTQRRPMPQPFPRARSEDEWEPDTVRRRVPEREASMSGGEDH